MRGNERECELEREHEREREREPELGLGFRSTMSAEGCVTSKIVQPWAVCSFSLGNPDF